MSDKPIEVGKWAVVAYKWPCCMRPANHRNIPFIVTAIGKEYGSNMRCSCGADWRGKPIAYGIAGKPNMAAPIAILRRIDDPPAEESTEEKRELETQ